MVLVKIGDVGAILARTLLLATVLLLALTMAEAVAALFMGLCSPIPERHRQEPISIIVCAYLPNEVDIIVSRVQMLLNRIRSDLGDQIILCYRSSGELNIESTLRGIAAQNDAFSVMRITTGEGKADQLNQALEHVKNDLVYLLDADALPDKDSIGRAASSFLLGFNVIQGRNMISNTSHLLGKMVAVEFAAKYMVSHFVRSRLADVSYFCGSNAMWQAGVARNTGFTNASLVEDVEASVRADIEGCRITIEPSIAATELAPYRLRHWWLQRRRWAQGWIDVGTLHIRSILVHPGFSVWKKLNWVYVIYVRRLSYSILTGWLIVLGIWLNLSGNKLGWVMLGFFVCCQSLSGLCQSLAVAVQCKRIEERRIRASWLILFAVLYPIYDLLKNAVTIAAVAEVATGRRDWSVTPRLATTCAFEAEEG